MARTTLPRLLLAALLLVCYSSVSAMANPYPEPTRMVAARQATATTSAAAVTTTCTSTGFNSAKSLTTVTGKCVIQACETATADPNGRAMTNTGICTLTPIGGAAAGLRARPTGAVAGAVAGFGVGVGVLVAAL